MRLLDSLLVLGLLPVLPRVVECLRRILVELAEMLVCRQVLVQSIRRVYGLVGRRRVLARILENDLCTSWVLLSRLSNMSEELL